LASSKCWHLPQPKDQLNSSEALFLSRANLRNNYQSCSQVQDNHQNSETKEEASCEEGREEGSEEGREKAQAET
jgi:flagellar biosynthesis/type III secretory pathway protein FliH